MKINKVIYQTLALILIVLTTSGYVWLKQENNPFLGDWKTKDSKFYAQVYLTKEGAYKVNLTDKLNSLEAPKAILTGSIEDKTLKLTGDGWDGKIENKRLLIAKAGEKLEMNAFKRTSPTMNAAPPKGAIVLYDGKNLNEWAKL